MNQESPVLIVVDDSDDDFMLIQRRVLQAWPNAALIHVDNPASLREALEGVAPDIVICDYSMPDITHDEAARLVNEYRPDTPLILLSGHATDALGVLAMQGGIRDYVEKSKPERLVPAIERELKTRQLKHEKAQLEMAHRRAVFFDANTGLLNRLGLETTLPRLLGQSEGRLDLALLTIRMSRRNAQDANAGFSLKKHGMQKTLERCQQLFKNDIICRWSENLLVVITGGFDWNRSLTDSIERLDSIESELCRPFVIESIPVRPSIHIGLARVGADGTNPAELVQHAQAVCAVLQTDNKGLFNALQTNTHEAAARRKAIEKGLAYGIEHNELTLDYQPVQDLHTNKVIGVEALVRWTHPTLGRIMPQEFIGVAEDSGLIEALGFWVLEHAVERLLKLHQQGHTLWCAVNCSPGQLLNPDFAKTACEHILSKGLDPKWIEFEITESAAIDDMDRTVKALNKLRSYGCHIAMDDFGTGYASLNYLRALPVDVLKIDKSFVMDLLSDTSSQMIVKAVIDLAHALKLTVHAEGIETDAQRQTLIDMGCDRLQGYLYAKPLDSQQLMDWLA